MNQWVSVNNNKESKEFTKEMNNFKSEFNSFQMTLWTTENISPKN